MPSLGKKYDLKIEVTSKPRQEYGTAEYLATNLPAAPAILIGEEVIVKGRDISKENLEAAICRHLGIFTREHKPHSETLQLDEANRQNLIRYRSAALFYDILDFPWELQYRKWRPALVGDMHGEVVEAGVGTGRNFKYYSADVNLTAIDFSTSMLKRAMRRAQDARCSINLICEDACQMKSIPSEHYDWVLSTFLCCVIPADLQHLAVEQFVRILKPGGRFRLLEMIYSKDSALRKRQKLFSRFVEKVYGARFDRNTLKHVEGAKELEITKTEFLKHDVYLVIEGIKKG
jgi:ubiquinone/menaquinone biosynthesis C-methylase UbiE